MACQYEHFNRETGEMEECGSEVVYPENLCAFHLAFHKDATGTFSKSKKSHPADWNWLTKARQAYGCKRINWGSAFPLGIPVTAGPMPKVWGTA